MENRPVLHTRRDLLLFLNRFRVHCIRKHVGKLNLDGVIHRIRFLALQEEKKRDVNELKTLFFQVEESECKFPYSASEIQIPFENGSLSVIGEDLVHLGSDLFKIGFHCNNVRFINRRAHDRHNEQSTNFSFVHVQTDTGQFQGMGRIIDSDPSTVSLELVVTDKLDTSTLKGASIRLLANHLTIQNLPMNVIKVYQVTKSNTDFGEWSCVKVVLKKQVSTKFSRNSLLDENRKKNLLVNVEIQSEEIQPFRLKIIDVSPDGFVADFEDSYESRLFPELFNVKIEGLELQFKCILNRFEKTGQVNGFILAMGVGARIAWANFISHSFFDVETSFQKVTPESLMDLAVMGGGQSPGLMSFLLPLRGYLQNAYLNDVKHSKTRLRWIKTKRGKVLGHYLGIRVSERLWATVDNMVSYSFSGSWMKDYVQEWTKLFVSMMDGEQVILLGFVPSSGVWNLFDEEVRNRPDLLLARNRFWLTNLVDGKVNQKTSNLFTATQIEHPASNGFEILEKQQINEREYFKLICEGTQGNEDSTFQSEFISEHGRPLTRYFYKIQRNGEDTFILSFSDYPFWVGINRGHDHPILFDLGITDNLSEEEECALFNLVIKTISSKSCSPVGLVIASQKLRTQHGVEVFHLLLYPSGLAESVKGFRSL